MACIIIVEPAVHEFVTGWDQQRQGLFEHAG